MSGKAHKVVENLKNTSIVNDICSKTGYYNCDNQVLLWN